MTASTNGAYNDSSVAGDTEGSLESARVVAPVVLKFVQPNSVIDFGCGRGAWLKAFRENGVRVIQGLDGTYVDQSKLLIDKSAFRTVDLSRPVKINGQWDLAICVEVAEHLPDEAGRPLVEALTNAAPLVLFAAAIPGQTGTNHINEQWPNYWQTRFAERGYRKLDPIRRHIWQDRRVEWWYRQNILLYASDEALAKSDALRAVERSADGLQIEWVHESILENYKAALQDHKNALERHKSLRVLLSKVPPAALRAIRRRLHWHR